MHWRSVEFAGTVVLVGNSFLGMGMFEEGRGDVLMLMPLPLLLSLSPTNF
jgi:hypothetical protein